MVTVIQDTLGIRSTIKNQFKYGHNLNKVFHGKEVWDLYRKYFVNGSPMKIINHDVMVEFLARHPECWCKDVKTFKQWANNSVSGWKYYQPSEEDIDRMKAMCIEAFDRDNFGKQSTARHIYNVINERGYKRVATLAIIGDIWEDVLKDYFPITPDHYWKPEYDDILMKEYFAPYGGVYNHVKRFNIKVKKRFSDYFIRKKILTLVDRYKVEGLPLSNIEPEIVDDIKDNIVEFKDRNLTKEEIINKVRFHLEVEGYDVNVPDEALAEYFDGYLAA